MFLKCSIRRKDGKEHRSWSIVESRRLRDGHIVQRHVLYLGEINDSQLAGWQKSIAVFEEGEEEPRQVALFPEDRVGAQTAVPQIQIKLGELTLHRPRQWGACWLALALFIVALAQPRLVKGESQIKASGIDIVVAIDMSGSMRSEDFGEGESRIKKAKEVLSKFIDNRPNDRIGLVAFAKDAYIASPLTLDHDFLQHNLDRLAIGLIDESRTAIGSALITAVNRLEGLKDKSKIVILMTDGENNSGKVSPLTAADVAQSLGIKVYTIGIGMRGKAPYPQVDQFGRKHYVMMDVDIDEDTLTKIAESKDTRARRIDWVGFVSFGALYCLIPWIWNKKLYSLKLVNWHFWISTIGIVFYISAMWVAGIMQGLMWRAYTPQGFLEYSFVETTEALHPEYLIRAAGGGLFVIGMLIMLVNIYKTIVAPKADEVFEAAASPIPAE